MNMRVAENVPCAKGAICYCLDEFSKGRGARVRVSRLRDAIVALAPSYRGLTEVFDRYLVSHVTKDADERARIVNHLERHWFGDPPPEPFFRGPVASIYAQGVIKALDLALAGRRVVPLNAWWLLDYPEVKLLSLADVDQAGVTIGGRVALLILTPRPQGGDRPTRTPILGETAQASVTGSRDNSAITIDVRRG